MVLQETYHRIELALPADCSFDFAFDRSILKSLGKWLGLLILARDIPISEEYLPLKAELGKLFQKYNIKYY